MIRSESSSNSRLAEVKRRENLPRLSIVVPSYNQVKYVEESILSILNQNYGNLELIVIDGGSTDGTVDVLHKYERHFSYWCSEPDRGQSDALNKGFTKATGDIYGWLNSDDLYAPQAFETAITLLEQSPSKRVLHGDWVTIDNKGTMLTREYTIPFSLGQFIYEGFFLNAQAMFWRREVHQRFTGFDVTLHRTMDYQMIVEFGLNEGDAAFMLTPGIIGCFRRHPDQKTQGMDDLVLQEHQHIAQRYRYTDKYSAYGQVKRLAYRLRRAYWYYRRVGIRYVVMKLVG